MEGGRRGQIVEGSEVDNTRNDSIALALDDILRPANHRNNAVILYHSYVARLELPLPFRVVIEVFEFCVSEVASDERLRTHM